MRKQENFDQQRYENFCDRLKPFVEEFLKKGYTNWSANLTTYGTIYDILESHFRQATWNVFYGFPVFMAISNAVNENKTIESTFRINIDDGDNLSVEHAKYSAEGVKLDMDIRSIHELPSLAKADKMLDAKIRAAKKMVPKCRQSMR